MTTHRLPILGFGALPDESGDVFFEPYSVKATNAKWERLVCIFEDSGTKIGLHGGFTVPSNYVNTSGLVIVWTSTATVNDVEWEMDYRAVGGDDTESLDQATAQRTIGGNDTAPSAINERMELTIAMTDADLAADDEVEFEFYRDGTDVGDGMAAAAIVFQLLFEYNDV